MNVIGRMSRFLQQGAGAGKRIPMPAGRRLGEDGKRRAAPASPVGYRRQWSLGITTRRMLAVAAELDLVSGLFTVFAAVFSESSLGLDEAFARRMSTLRRWRHNSPLA